MTVVDVTFETAGDEVDLFLTAADEIEVILSESIDGRAYTSALVAAETARATAAEAAISAGLRFATVTTVYTSNVASRSGLPTNDGVTHSDGAAVLLTAQSSGTQNGPWLVHSGAWTRPAWYATGGHAEGVYIYVEAGTLQGTSSWVVSGAGPYIIDTNVTTWVQASGLGEVTVVAPVVKSGNQLSVTVGTGANTLAAGNDSRITGAVQTGSNPATGVSVTTSGLVVVTHTNVQSALADLDAAIGLPMFRSAGNPGLTGATGATRYVGGTTSGAPASGTFVVGDFIVDRSGAIWVCTSAGSPGTWVNAGGNVSLSTVAGTLGSNTATGTSGSFADIMSTSSLAIGTWLVHWAAEVTGPAIQNGQHTVQCVTGTAVTTFTGPTAATVNNPGASPGPGVPVNLPAVLATVTTAGTLKLQATNAGSSAGSVNKTAASGSGVVTGYTAVKIA